MHSEKSTEQTVQQINNDPSENSQARHYIGDWYHFPRNCSAAAVVGVHSNFGCTSASDSVADLILVNVSALKRWRKCFMWEYRDF